MRILGIESSCDETAAAVVEDGVRILSSEVATQVEVHHKYGGVVPELASRQHVEAICPVVDAALEKAGITASEIDAVAATQGPGLVGALLVGFSFAKAFSWTLGVPMIGVNHLLGHIHSVFLTENPPAYPFVALLVSGGHSALYHVTDPVTFTLLGQTRDDAAGEAYDKVSKMLGLGYPGGALIDGLAAEGEPGIVTFPRPYLDKTAYDFSFSGLKSAVGRFLAEDGGKTEVRHIAAEFQAAVSEVLVYKTLHAAKETGCEQVVIGGGVAANRGLRERMAKAAKAEGIRLHVPPLSLCGDNAAMIAAAGFHVAQHHPPLDLSDDVYSRIQYPGRPKKKHR